MGLAIQTSDRREPPNDDAVDRALLAATAEGDVAAFERLYRRRHPQLVEFAARITGRRELAEELASDALSAAWRGAARFEGRSRVSTWLFGIVYRLSKKAAVKAARRARDVAYDDDAHAPLNERDDVEAAFLRSQVARALTELSHDHRAVIEMTYYHGLRYSEIAEIMECPVGTVKTRMMHARARLRQVMSDSNVGHAPRSRGRETSGTETSG